ncbi:hypothetical protein CCP3SC5AM1_40038 [Gammaproteobacteria bacterium]
MLKFPSDVRTATTLSSMIFYPIILIDLIYVTQVATYLPFSPLPLGEGLFGYPS